MSYEQQDTQDLPDIALNFDSPESSIVKGASYDPNTLILTVEFPSGIYTYDGVDLGLWEAFSNAESKGGFFSKQIRPLFHGRKK